MKRKNKLKREWVRSREFDKHHLTPRSRGGDCSTSNLLRMDTRRHQAWHLLFNNLTLDEIIELLARVKELKKKYHFDFPA